MGLPSGVLHEGVKEQAHAALPPAAPGPAPALAGADGGGTAPDGTVLPGPVISQADPQALFATESLAQALRQVEVCGHEGLPVLSADGRQISGWVAAPDVLRAIGRQLTTAQAELAADGDHAGPGTRPRHPPTPRPGYRLVEITITAGSPVAGRNLADVTWPPGSTLVSVLRGHQLRPPHPELTLAPGDRVSLLTAAPGGSPERRPGGEHHAQPAGQETSHHR
jgi:CIC family chloride channel protein